MELDLRELKSEVFYDQIGYLSGELGDPERYFPSLKAEGVLDETDCEIIRSKVTSREKVDAFVETVYKRESSTGEPAFDVFVELLLSQVVQAYIARALQQAFAKRKEMSAFGRKRLEGERQLSKSMDELSIGEVSSGLESLVRQAPVDCHESRDIKQTVVGSLGANGARMMSSTLGSTESFPTANGGLGYLESAPNARRPVPLRQSVGTRWDRSFTERHHRLPAARDDQYLSLSQSLNAYHSAQQFRADKSTKARSLTRILSQQVLEEQQEEEEAAENYGFECSICMEKYKDEGLRVPRNLMCGHTYCTGE